MPNFSIRSRLIFLSILLLAILAGSSAFLIRELVRDSQSLNEEVKLVSIVKNANSASKHFGDLKYWAIDSAVTQLAASQQKADLAASGLNSDLKAISDVDPTVVEAIEGEVYTMTDLARQAGVAYSSDDSAAGNALLSQAKSRVVAIDDHLDKIVERRRATGPGAARCIHAPRRICGQAGDRGRNRSAGARVGLHRIHRSLDYRSPETAGREHCFNHPWRIERRYAALGSS